MRAARGGLRLVPAAAEGQQSGVELLAEWAGWLRAFGAADTTVETRVGGVQVLCSHAGIDDPASITTTQLIAWLGNCKAPWTRYTYAATARAWFQWLVERGYRADDPTAGLPVPRAPRGVPRPVSSRALADALAVSSRKARAYMTLAAYAGLRVHEVAKVRGEDFADGWLYVTGKGGVRAALPVHHLLEQLQRGWPEQGPWFPGSNNGHVRPQTVSDTIARAFEKAGHKGVTAHQLRHWYGTQLQRTGGDTRVTQELMRHASLQSTQIYTEVSSSSKVAAVQRLGRQPSTT